MGDATPKFPTEAITRSYQQEMLNASLTENTTIVQNTGPGKTHIGVPRMKFECDREPHNVMSPL